MWPALLLLAVGVGGLAWGQAASPPGPYAGSETCAVCHEDIGSSFRRNPHSLVKSGCESCHGPGKEHAEAADPTKIFRFRNATPARTDEQCLSCHAGGSGHSSRQFGGHFRSQTACTACHSVHQASARPLLAKEPNALCQQCHLNVKAEFTRPFRHKLNQGAIDCVDCHDAHGASAGRDLKRVSANDSGCLKCHGDKRGPFPFEHAPVRLSSCSTCHEPHGSANPRMLTRHDQSLLCLECHTTTLTRAGGTPPAFHDLRSARIRNCTICHSKIHGSFVSRDFLR